jgi:uncharacterized protein (TIGR02246 family)
MQLALLAVMLTVVAAQLSAAESPRANDDAAVREVVRKYTQARTLEDATAIEALFTSDADQHTTSGEWRRGRDQVVPGTLRSSANAPGTRRIDVDTVRFVTEDVAIVDGPYVIGEGANARRNWTTLLLKREAGTWRISAIRNMAPTGGNVR